MSIFRHLQDNYMCGSVGSFEKAEIFYSIKSRVANGTRIWKMPSKMQRNGHWFVKIQSLYKIIHMNQELMTCNQVGNIHLLALLNATMIVVLDKMKQHEEHAGFSVLHKAFT